MAAKESIFIQIRFVRSSLGTAGIDRSALVFIDHACRKEVRIGLVKVIGRMEIKCALCAQMKIGTRMGIGRFQQPSDLLADIVLSFLQLLQYRLILPMFRAVGALFQ